MAESVSISKIFGGMDEPEMDFSNSFVCRICNTEKILHYHCTQSIFNGIVKLKIDPVCDACAERMEEDKIKLEMAKYSKENAIASGVPEEFLEWDRSKGNIAMMSFLCRNVNKSIYLHDKPDTNKTRCLSRMVQYVFEKDYRSKVKFYNFNTLCSAYIALTREDYAKADALKKQLGTCDLLVIDDFGKQRISECIGDMLYAVVNKIYERGSRIWISVNRPADELINRFEHRETGEVIFSRFDRIKDAGKMAHWNHGNGDV